MVKKLISILVSTRLTAFLFISFSLAMAIGTFIESFYGTDASKMLLNKMHKYTSDHAHCIIFDPTQTLHRGGLCNKGHRINLQILMR